MNKGGSCLRSHLTDYNNDNKLDLLVLGEWMPVRSFQK
jgi:hypothetical protein